nr:S24 family peptidase [Methylophaga nitratireducenticrescens]
MKISGESMIGKGIMSGHYVVVESTRQAKHSDMFVALVDGYDATLKTML